MLLSKLLKLMVNFLLIWAFCTPMIQCSKKTQQNQNPKKDIKVRVELPQEKNIQETLQVLGNISASKEVAITAEIMGKVILIKKQEGDQLITGELLCKINPEPFDLAEKKALAALEQASANLNYAQNIYQDALLSVEKKLHDIEKSQIQLIQSKLELEETERDFKNKKILYQKEGLSTTSYKKIELQLAESKAKYELAQKNYNSESIGFRDKDIQDAYGSIPSQREEKITKLKELRSRTEKAKLEIAQNEYQKTKIDLEEAQLMRKKCEIYAPISGVVGVKKINEGEMIQKDNPLFVLFHIDKVFGDFEITEENIGKISRQDQVVFKADAYPQKEFRGSVAIINPLISPKTRTGMIRVEVNNVQEQLRVGMFIRGTIYTRKKRKVMTIPAKALFTIKGDKGEVFVEKNRYVIKKTILVETDKIEESYIVREGLEPDDKIVVSSNQELVEGMAVVLEKTDPS